MPPSAFDNSVLPLGLREFKLFRTLIHDRTGIWLRDGKQVMLASRLSRRLRHHGIASFGDYYHYVQSGNNGDELRELINCVTTNKTSFFRERHHFDFLAKTVASRIQSEARSGTHKSIRVWSAACSTGEEPYSIAITLLEALQTPASLGTAVGLLRAAARTGSARAALLPGSRRIEVVASDIDTKVLDTAIQAVYSESSLEMVAPNLQRKYFLQGKDDMQGKVKVKREVTQLVEFKNINLMDAQWPLEDLFDVIFFRNALIYFNQDTQNIFLRKMALHLKPSGYLFLGNSEHVPWLADIFAPLNQTMYQLRDLPR